MPVSISLEEYKKAYRKIRREEEMKNFFIHLVIYIFVNSLLISVNLMYFPKILWFFYPLIGWGIGIIIHYLFGIRWLEKTLKEREIKAELRAREMKNTSS